MGIRSTFSGLEIARSGLTVAQSGLDVTGQNVANADTEGYTRQRIVQKAIEPYNALRQYRPVNQALVGSGAQVVVLDQIRSKYLDRQYRTENTLATYWNTRQQALEYVEPFFEDTSASGLNSSLQTFFSAINAGTLEANDAEQRRTIRSAGSALCQNLNMLYDRLTEQQKNSSDSIAVLTKQINTIADNIARLNQAIYTYELDGQRANDLRDQRNLLLDELSSIADVRYEGEEWQADGNAKLKVWIGSGEGEGLLIDHKTTRSLEVASMIESETGNSLNVAVWGDIPSVGTSWIPTVAYEDPASTGGAAPVYSKDYPGGMPGVFTCSGGEMKAHMDLCYETNPNENAGIPYFAAQLNALARALASEINAIHSTGWTHPASGSTQTGINFFYMDDGIAGITAGNIRLSDEVIASEYNIAAAQSADGVYSPYGGYPQTGSTEYGNNLNLQSIYNLLNKTDINIGGEAGSIFGFIGKITSDVAQTLAHAKSVAETENTQALNAENLRQSISGVSLDEEMTNLIKYQHAYTGAARVISTMDEALDVLINRTGKVGL